MTTGQSIICSLPKAEYFEKLRPTDFSYMNSQPNLTEKIACMEEQLLMTEWEIEERKRIVRFIKNLLRRYYPECDIIVYGSSSNGFGFRGCDLDLLFLPFPEYCNIDYEDRGKGDALYPHAFQSKYIPRAQLERMNEEMHLKFVQRVLIAVKDYFKRVLFIPARCPILNIDLMNSPITCDLSASNRFVEYNTDLLWLFGKLDHRVRPLVSMLRYWAKSLGFIAKNLLSSYCFTLMVIFFLQNTYPAVLPSVQKLKDLAGYSRIIDGWETAICMDEAQILAHRNLNISDTHRLLVEFFDFYLEFNFVQNIVSPYFGRPLPVKELKESQDERIRSFQVIPFSIQDPFILSRNLGKYPSKKTSFKLAVMIARNLLCDRNFPLELLFDRAYYEYNMNACFGSVRTSLPAASTFSTLQLTYELSHKLGITTDLNPWFDRGCQVFIDILKYGLFIDCEIVDKVVFKDEKLNHRAKRQKLNVDITREQELKLILSIQCCVNFATMWKKNRDDVQGSTDKKVVNDQDSDYDENVPDCLRKEYEISKKIAKSNVKPISKVISVQEAKLPYLTFSCDFYTYPQVSDIVFAISPLSNNPAFKEVKPFLHDFIRKHVQKILGEV